jgi:phosphoribosylaminoimidazole-succinocarboxamide synthase
LQRAAKLPHPIFTPATKAEAGAHDENIDFAAVEKLLGAALAAAVRDAAIRLYREAAEYALARGIIIADTKFEFGLDDAGKLYLIDEALTPDSSRFWPSATYQAGVSPESFDKQYVRNWLESIGFNKMPPGPQVPADIAQKTSDKYREALTRLKA